MSRALRVLATGVMVGSLLFRIEGLDPDLPFYLLWTAVLFGLIERAIPE